MGAAGTIALIGSDSDLATSGAGWSGTSPGTANFDYTGVVRAYSGGVLNTVGIYRSGSFVSGAFLILWGGGHGDYAGNEMYAFGPLAGTPTWSRIIDPTVPGPDDVARSGGYPVSRHTYDGLIYLPTQNQMLSPSVAGRYSDGGNSNAADVFDFDTNPTGNPWTTADTDLPNLAGAAGGSGMLDGVSGYDGTHAWIIGRGNATRLARCTASDKSWSSWSLDNPDMGTDCKAGLAPGLSLMAYTTTTGAVRAIDLRGTPAVFTPTVTGSSPGVDRCAMEWDPVAEQFVVYPGTGKTFYLLTPGADPYSGGDSWAWSTTTPSGSTPPDQNSTGTHGRFRYAAIGNTRGFVLMPDYDSGVWFWRRS